MGRGAGVGALLVALTLAAGTVGVPIVLTLPAAALCASVARGASGHLVRTAASAAAAVALAWVVASAWTGPRPSAATGALAALAGGLLGVVAVVPWRRLWVGRARLPFAEGEACGALAAGPRGPLLLGAAAGAALSAVAAVAGVVGRGGAGGPSGLAAGFLIGLRPAAAVFAGATIAAWLRGSPEDRLVPIVAIGALFGAGLVAVARSLPAWRASRADAAPYRVRFEIGGEGTRIEDMTPPADRDLGVGSRGAMVVASVLLLVFPAALGPVEAVLLVGGVAALLVPLAARVAGRVGMLLMPAVALAAAAAVDLGGTALGAAGGVAPTIVAAVAVAVGADLAQSFAANAPSGVEPRRTARAALLGVVVAVALLGGVAVPDLWTAWFRFGDLGLNATFAAVPWGGLVAGLAGGAVAALVAPKLALPAAGGRFL
ncbi:MAG: hypothetical protein ACF8XB_09055, partial [Planctomycetota bacterium JB042]